MRRSTLTIAAYLLVVFVSGISVGAFGYRLVSGTPVSAKATPKLSPEEWRREYLNEMQNRVKLTPDQLGQLNTILDETRSRFHTARENHDQLVKTIRAEQTNKIRQMLTDAQKPEYERLRAERDQRAKAANGGK
jgi:uncharacterized membrane protein